MSDVFLSYFCAEIFSVPHQSKMWSLHPLLIIPRCWKLDTGFAISPHRHRHHQFVTALCAQVVSVPISPPSFLTLHLGAACMSFLATSSALTYWFLYPCLPVKGSVVIYVFQPLSFDVSLPPNERQSVSESSERYLWCCQNDSSGRRVVSPFVLFICRTYSYQLWRLLHTRKYHH